MFVCLSDPQIEVDVEIGPHEEQKAHKVRQNQLLHCQYATARGESRCRLPCSYNIAALS